MLAADGDVHTNEEAQVHVHDLNPFVTVQFLEAKALAILSLGKLCEDHGYSNDRRSKAAGDKRREDNCMQKSQFRTSCRSRVIHQFWKQLVGNIDISGFVVNPAQEGSDELVPRRWCGSPLRTQNKDEKRDDSRDADDRLRDLLEWLEEFRS